MRATFVRCSRVPSLLSRPRRRARRRAVGAPTLSAIRACWSPSCRGRGQSCSASATLGGRSALARARPGYFRRGVFATARRGPRSARPAGLSRQLRRGTFDPASFVASPGCAPSCSFALRTASKCRVGGIHVAEASARCVGRHRDGLARCCRSAGATRLCSPRPQATYPTTPTARRRAGGRSAWRAREESAEPREQPSPAGRARGRGRSRGDQLSHALPPRHRGPAARAGRCAWRQSSQSARCAVKRRADGGRRSRRSCSARRRRGARIFERGRREARPRAAFFWPRSRPQSLCRTQVSSSDSLINSPLVPLERTRLKTCAGRGVCHFTFRCSLLAADRSAASIEPKSVSSRAATSETRLALRAPAALGRQNHLDAFTHLPWMRVSGGSPSPRVRRAPRRLAQTQVSK